MYTLRTRIKKDIVCEFVAPKKKSNKVIILCGGQPGFPAKKEMLIWLAERGYWAFYPRYRGSWESGGSFLKITIAKWLTPKGDSISEVGLDPDVKVDITDQDVQAQKDPQLAKALEIVKNLK